MKESEMVDGFFSYEKKTCRGMLATYVDCTLNMQIGHQYPGTHIDEILIDYSTGKIQLAETEGRHKILEEFILDLVIHDGTNILSMAPAIDEKEPTYDEVPEEKKYMDASVAIAMLEQGLSTLPKPNFGIPDKSHTFGQYIEENRAKDGLPPKDSKDH